MSHITVERNRRKQMNEHLKVLRSLTPCFYVKRGDQASIIGGVIEFIKELHLILESLESKKKRKSPSPSPKALQLTPLDHTFNFENSTELGASCNSSIADVEAKVSGSNVILRTISRRVPGLLVKIIQVLETHSFEITHLNISSMDETVLYSFVIKIGLECQLSLEELVLEVQQSFSQAATVAIQL
ncbi:transcription factor MUTE [Aristolochia californica]|uniref:transcription factor MUTE n=1 Tax=Aristolochia californica TaxID=171875 RepID=UPI0035E37D69